MKQDSKGSAKVLKDKDRAKVLKDKDSAKVLMKDKGSAKVLRALGITLALVAVYMIIAIPFKVFGCNDYFGFS